MAFHMANDKMNLSDFLSQQTDQRQPLLATIESVANAQKVKVTPWRPHGGCKCSAALEIERLAVASVRPTNDVHDCCGSSRRVVEVEFVETAQHLFDVFAQLLARADAEDQLNIRRMSAYPVEDVGARDHVPWHGQRYSQRPGYDEHPAARFHPNGPWSRCRDTSCYESCTRRECKGADDIYACWKWCWGQCC